MRIKDKERERNIISTHLVVFNVFIGYTFEMMKFKHVQIKSPIL